jgi:hypothetical protein
MSNVSEASVAQDVSTAAPEKIFFDRGRAIKHAHPKLASRFAAIAAVS